MRATPTTLVLCLHMYNTLHNDEYEYAHRQEKRAMSHVHVHIIATHTRTL